MKKYIVKKGDNLWNIAKINNISLDEIYKLNPTLKTKKFIHINDVIKLSPDIIKEDIDIKKEWEDEKKLYNSLKNTSDLDYYNKSIIQAAKQDDNYAILNKKTNTIQIFNANDELLYESNKIGTGKSHTDYNTITKIKDGKLLNYQGNNSTPGGITKIGSIGEYHGAPSFVRQRINSDGSFEDIASSIHIGNITDNNNSHYVSNGCVRVDKTTANELNKYLNVGSCIYTLPEQKESRFSLKGGKLNYISDNPYGIQTGDKRFEDDYNVTIDKSYAPLTIKYNNTGNKEYDNNRKLFIQAIVDNKKDIQKRFNITSDEYNRLANLALGIAQQESEYGTGTKYKLKQFDFLVDVAKTITNNKSANSKGLTQIKIKADLARNKYDKNKDAKDKLLQYYKYYNINEETINAADKSAMATIARLADMYINEVKGKNFKGLNDKTLTTEEVLLYKWSGQAHNLGTKKNNYKGIATPEKNIYIQNVNKYSKDYKMYETRTRKQYNNGGSIKKLHLDDIIF